MNSRQRSDLDNYITGHYGEDQFKQEPGAAFEQGRAFRVWKTRSSSCLEDTPDGTGWLKHHEYVGARGIPFETDDMRVAKDLCGIIDKFGGDAELHADCTCCGHTGEHKTNEHFNSTCAACDGLGWVPVCETCDADGSECETCSAMGVNPINVCEWDGCGF